MNTSKRRSRVSKNVFTTRSGKSIKVNRSLSARVKASKDGKALRKAERMSGLPKSRFKRFFYRLHPKRLANYWFSREGGTMALKILGIGLISGFLLLVGLFAFFRKDLPNLKDISGDNIGGSIRYYDRTGKIMLFEDYDAIKRIPVKQDQMSKYVLDATVAIEDKDFYKHGGFDVRGIMRAGVNNAIGRSGGQQGGSTITQQLVKLSQDWTKDRSYTRKVKEIILAVELERSYSKEEILTGYLNTAPYGGIEYGVEAAARNYFQKSAKDLTLDEAAFFAAIPKSPAYYSPYSTNFDKESTVGRQHYILDQMVTQGMIKPEERDAAKKVDTFKKVKPRKPKYDGIIAPWFVLAAKEQLEEQQGEYGIKKSGWKITTTLDMDLQKKAEEQVNKGMPQVRRQGGDTAGFVAEDVTTGQTVALVGGSDFRNKTFGENNYARLRLPPGSSFKPYDYAALIENTNSGAGSVLYDTQGPLEGYPCTNKSRPQSGGNCLQNYDFRYPGPVTIRYALGGSRNVPAVKAMLISGIDKTIQTAEKLGLKSGYKCYADEGLTKEQQCYASSAIGDGAYMRLDEHVHGYASLSRNGVNIPQTYILKIQDSNNKTLDEWKPSKGTQAIKPETAYIISDILSDPNASYFFSKAHSFNGWKYSLKTGTTNDTKDGLLMGYSTKYAAGVWVGYHNRQVEMSGFMETMTRPIWKGWMDAAHANIKPIEREKPAGVQSLPAYLMRSKAGGGQIVPSPSNDLFPSWYKRNSSSSRIKQTIDIVSNKLATDCTPPKARKETSDAAANQFSSDIFVGGGSANQANSTEKDDVHKCSDAKPRISLSVEPSGDKYNLIATFNPGTFPLSSDKFKGNITFSANGKGLPGGSYEVSKGGTIVYQNYKPTGKTTITVSITDSVLYDSSDSETVSGSTGTNSGPSLTSAVKGSGSNVTVSWTGGAAPITIRKQDGGIICVSNGTSCSGPYPGVVAGTSKVYATDNNGNTSAFVTVF